MIHVSADFHTIGILFQTPLDLVTAVKQRGCAACAFSPANRLPGRSCKQKGATHDQQGAVIGGSSDTCPRKQSWAFSLVPLNTGPATVISTYTVLTVLPPDLVPPCTVTPIGRFGHAHVSDAPANTELSMELLLKQVAVQTQDAEPYVPA
jgi:hypothetical protein